MTKTTHDHRARIDLDDGTSVIECECGHKTEPSVDRGEAELRWLTHCSENGVEHWLSEDEIEARVAENDRLHEEARVAAAEQHEREVEERNREMQERLDDV